MSDLAELPDLVVDKILQLIPAKTGVQISLLTEQWQGVLFSIPELSFDEGVDFGHHDLGHYYDYLIRHNKFINFLDGYLSYRKKYDQTAPLHKLRIHTTMYVCEDSPTIQRWLAFANERGVKTLDLSAKMTDPKEYGDDESRESINDYDFYLFPWDAFINAKFLTTLKLEEIAICHIQRADNQSKEQLLPSMKYMFFTNVWFADKALVSLLSECPFVEYMSLNDCVFEKYRCHISSSSLKSLFFFHSDEYLKSIDIDICVDNLERFGLNGPLRSIDATMNNENLSILKFFGYCGDKLSLKADEAILVTFEVAKEPSEENTWTQFISQRSFVRRFYFCKDIHLHIQDVKAFIFPQRLIKKFPSPLPQTINLQVSMKKPVKEGSRDYWSLMDSLRWLAPSARIIIVVRGGSK